MDLKEFARLMAEWEKKRALTVSQIYVILFALLLASFFFSVTVLFTFGIIYGSAVSVFGASFVAIFFGESVSAVLSSMTVVLIVDRMRNANARREWGSGDTSEDLV